jgi:tetratricopeptide (TPR) repeat protein
VIPLAELGPYWTSVSETIPTLDPADGRAISVRYSNVVEYSRRTLSAYVGVFRTPKQAQDNLAALIDQLHQQGLESEDFGDFADGAVFLAGANQSTLTYGVGLTTDNGVVLVQVAGPVPTLDAAYDLLRRAKQYAAWQQHRVHVGLSGGGDFTAPFCAPNEIPQFRFAFEDLRRAAGDLMGEAVECEHPDPTSTYTVQRTTKGVGAFHSDQGLTTFTQGDIHLALGDFGVAQWRGAETDPPPAAIVVALNSRALSRWTTGDDQAALNDLNRALAMDPNRGEAYNVRAYVNLALGDADQALSDAETAVRLSAPAELPFTLDTRAYVRYKRGEYQEALADYDAAFALVPQPASVTYLGRGLTRLALGDQDGGLADLQQGLQRVQDVGSDPQVEDLVDAALAALGDLQGP